MPTSFCSTFIAVALMCKVCYQIARFILCMHRALQLVPGYSGNNLSYKEDRFPTQTSLSQSVLNIII